MNDTHCERCGKVFEDGDPRAILRDAWLIVTLCEACVRAEYANPDEVPLYTSRKEYERRMIAKYGRE